MPKSVMIRVTEEVKTRLDVEIASLMETYQKGQTDVPELTDNNRPGFSGVSYSAFITRLLDQRDKKRWRSDAAKKRKRRKNRGQE